MSFRSDFTKNDCDNFCKTKCCARLKADHYLLKGADMKHFEKKRYLDITDRYDIEIGVSMRHSFKQIAEEIGRHPSTISREILENRTFIRGSFLMGNDCRKVMNCYNKRHMCGDTICHRRCIGCIKWDCRRHCSGYVSRHCTRIEKPPYVCNNCFDKRHCNLNRYIYSAKYAQIDSDARRSRSRQGIHSTKAEIEDLNELLVPRLKSGQPLAHIYESHKDEIPVSLRTLYNYVEQGELQVKNIDLRRKVRYRKRRKRRDPSTFQQEYRKGRTYEDFQFYMRKDKKQSPYVEMDTIIGARGSRKRILSMMLVERHILLLFLMPDGTEESVRRVFDYLEGLIGIDIFQRLLPVFLTDNGSEFKAPDSLEVNEFGEVRCSVFYCDPMSAWQKPHVEKVHEYVRYVLPKGTSFKDLKQDDLTLIANHINSVKRPSLKGNSPYDLVRANDSDLRTLLSKLKMHPIPPDEVHLTKDLLK